VAKAGHQSWRKGVRGRGQKEGNEEGREESRKRDGRGRTRECAARPQSTSPRREPSNDAVHGGSLGDIRGSSPRGERAQQGTGHDGQICRRYLSVPARCGGSTATTGTLADDGRCVVLPTKPRAMILAVVCFCLTRVLWHLSCVIHQRTQSHPPVSKTL
jgi:hypothetical protein